MSEVFAFRFDPRYRLAALPFGVTPRTAAVSVGDELTVRFGVWRLRTPLDNIKAVDITGPYTFVRTAGPVRLSFTDRGVTFATNGDSGVCVCFHEPVTVLDPTGLLKHPGATLTVADVQGLATRLRGFARALAKN